MTCRLLRFPWIGPAATSAEILPGGSDRSHTSSWDGPEYSVVSVLSDKGLRD